MHVFSKIILRALLALAVLCGSLSHPITSVQAKTILSSVQASGVTAFDLIVAMNTLRTSYGLPALVEDPIIDAVAQGTAQTMAASEMSWHIGNVSGRLQSAGYGGGAKVWGTENFAMGYDESIDQIMLVWSDDSHMIPAVNPAYCNVGAGTAKAANGMTYYVLQAAYTESKSCGEYKSPSGTTTTQTGTTTDGRAGGGSQLIVPVKIATPDADGKIYHIVQAGQSFWSIAVAYKITIKDLETWNNISQKSGLQIGQKLFIPSSNTAGFATPTPVGMVQISTPGSDGTIIHTVQTYQTLTTIAQAYNVKVDTILALNGIQVDWPLQIGQKLIIHSSNVTPSATPRPLTPLEKLTPESDGHFYHVVKSGETLSWIASLYEVKVADLMVWNSLSDSSILQVGQKLLLQVTPPATSTFTPGPPTATPTASETPLPPSPTVTASPTSTMSASTPIPGAGSNTTTPMLIISIVLVSGGVGLFAFLMRRKQIVSG
jgi:LysM repeat protein